MTQTVKLVCYVLLAIVGVWCGINFVRSYSKATVAKPAETSVESGETASAPPAQKGQPRENMMTYAFGLLLVILCGGFLAAMDVSKFFAHRFEQLVFDEE